MTSIAQMRIVLGGFLVVEAFLLLVGTVLPWRVVHGEADASVNGLYNIAGGSDNNSYLGPPVVMVSLVMLALSVATLVLARVRSKRVRLVGTLTAGSAVLLGIVAWRLADTNRRMVVDPGPNDLNWFSSGQDVGPGLYMVLATSVAVAITGAIALCLFLPAVTRLAAHD